MGPKTVTVALVARAVYGNCRWICYVGYESSVGLTSVVVNALCRPVMAVVVSGPSIFIG